MFANNKFKLNVNNDIAFYYYRCMDANSSIPLTSHHFMAKTILTNFHRVGDHEMGNFFENSKLASKYEIGKPSPTKTATKKESDPKIAARNTFLKAIGEQIEFHAAVSKGETFLVKRYKPSIKAIVETSLRPWWVQNGSAYHVYLKFGPGAINKDQPFVAKDFAMVGAILADFKSEAESGIYDDNFLELSVKMSEGRKVAKAT